MNTLNKRGLTVDNVMCWLNISRSYVYRLLREQKLEPVSLSPLLISTDSVIDRIGRTFPKVTAASRSLLDYQMKQSAGASTWN